MRARFPRLSSWGVAVVLTGLVSVFAMGWAATFVLASVAFMVFCLKLCLPLLRTPVVWALAIIACATLWTVGLFAVARFTSPVLSFRDAFITLSLPFIVGGIAALLVSRRRKWQISSAVIGGKDERVGVLVTLGILVPAAALRVAGGGLDLAWSMNGDSRNHVLIMRRVVDDGGLTLGGLIDYPSFINAVASTVAILEHGNATSALTLENEIRALTATYVLAVLGVAVMLAAGVLASSRSDSLRGSRSSLHTTVAAFGAASLAISAFILGFTVADGFLSSLGSLVFACASLVVGIHTVRSSSFATIGFAAIALATASTAISWPLLATIPLAAGVIALALGPYRLDRKRDESGKSGWGTRLRLGVLGASAIALTLALLWIAPGQVDRFNLSGSTSSIAPWTLVVITLVAIAVWCLSGSGSAIARSSALVAGVGAISLGTVGALLMTSGEGPVWSYYAQKSHWLFAAALSWLCFSAVARLADSFAARDGNPRRVTVASLATTAAVWLVLGNSSTAAEPISAIVTQQTSPTPFVASTLLEADERSDSFVFWDLDRPGADRLGNFWAIAAFGEENQALAAPLPADVQIYWEWAYFADYSDPLAICALIEALPGLTVYTASSNLPQEMNANCNSVSTPTVVVPNEARLRLP